MKTHYSQNGTIRTTKFKEQTKRQQPAHGLPWATKKKSAKLRIILYNYLLYKNTHSVCYIKTFWITH